MQLPLVRAAELHVGSGQTYTTIQAAITAASAGDTIIVHPGTYDEQVVITKPLTLQGYGDTTIIQPAGPGRLTSFYQLGTQADALWNGHKLASIISIQNVGPTGVTVKNLKVDGVYVNALPPGANYVVGISYGETAGTIDNVTVINMNSVPIATRTYGMWLDAVINSVSVEVKKSRINYYNKNAITARGAKLTVNIHDNTIVGPGTPGTQVPNGIMLTFGCGGTVSYNTVSGHHYTPGEWLSCGISGYDAKDGVIVDHNEVYDTDIGIGMHHSNGGSMYGNQLHDCGWGILLEAGSADNNIYCNQIHNNHCGIYLLGPGSPYYTGPGDESGPGNTAFYNNIYGNTEGVRNWISQVFNAEYNWWGDASGPHHSTLNPSGTGNSVSDNVDFAPWLTAPLSGVDSKTVPAGATTTVGSKDLGVSADVTTTTGTPTVTVATYTSNPGGKPTFSALGKYVDVHIDNAAGVTQILIKVYYTDAEVAASGITESTLKLYWWTGSAWVACSDTGVDTVNNYIWARITATSTPNLNQLTGTPFGAGGVKPAPVGGYVIPVSKASVLAPYLALFGLAGAIAVVAVKLRRRKA
ncbi:MAG: right-handed parallel beta-helix repeat-containing protein [Candidatus Bathyarchaeia archaeon]